MRSLTEATCALFRRLAQLWPFREQQPNAEHEAERISEIAEKQEPAAVPGLLIYLFSRSGAVAEAAANAIDRIAAKCSLLELVELDEKVREIGEWRMPHVNGKDIPDLSHGLTRTLGILSFNSSGFAREAAVRELSKTLDGRELPFLLIRLNDWVQQVRDAAKESVLSRLRQDYAGHFLLCLPLVDRLRGKSRSDHQQVYESIIRLLRSEECRPILRSAISSPDRQTRRLAFRLLAETLAEDQLDILRQAIDADDTVMRLWAARELRNQLDGQPLLNKLERLKADRFMPVRREALCGIAEKLPELASSYLHAALLDPHASMRETARFYLRQRGDQDFAAFYRGVIEKPDGPVLLAAIGGLGETGTAEDALRLIRFIDNNPNPRIRRAALRAIGRLNADAIGERLADILQDRVPRISKVARDIILAHPHLLPASRLSLIFEATDKRHVRRIILALVARLSWWESAPILVLAAGAPDADIRGYAQEKLRCWRTDPERFYIRPTPEQLRMLEEALAQCGAGLDGAIRNDLSDWLVWAKREIAERHL